MNISVPIYQYNELLTFVLLNAVKIDMPDCSGQSVVWDNNKV